MASARALAARMLDFLISWGFEFLLFMRPPPPELEAPLVAAAAYDPEDAAAVIVTPDQKSPDSTKNSGTFAIFRQTEKLTLVFVDPFSE